MLGTCLMLWGKGEALQQEPAPTPDPEWEIPAWARTISVPATAAPPPWASVHDCSCSLMIHLMTDLFQQQMAVDASGWSTAFLLLRRSGFCSALRRGIANEAIRKEKFCKKIKILPWRKNMMPAQILWQTFPKGLSRVFKGWQNGRWTQRSGWHWEYTVRKPILLIKSRYF